MPPDPALQELLRAQQGVIGRRQALLHMSERALDRRIRKDGPWQVMLPGIYGAFTGHPTERQQLWAAVLYAGAGAFITGATGCRHYGLKKAPKSDHIHVASTSRQVLPVGFAAVEQTRRQTWLRVQDGIPFARSPRCVVDAALRMTDLDDVRALIAEAVQRRKARVDQLDAELERAPKRGSALPRRALAEIALGARSAPECKQICIFSRSEVLPPLHYNCSLMGPDGWIADPDAYCEESGVAQEIDSVEFHIDPRAWKATMVRRSRMVASGVRVLEAAPSRLDRDGAGVLREFEMTHSIGLETGPPPGVWVRCRAGCRVKDRDGIARG